MAHLIRDRVRETSTTTGTGSFTLSGAVTGFLTWAGSGFVNNDTGYYCIEHQSANEWEVGLGTWTTGGVLVRTTPLAGSSTTPVNFTTGTKHVFLTDPASAQTRITDLTAETAPADADETVLWDASASTTDKVTLANLKTYNNTNDLHPGYSDYAAIADPAAPPASTLRVYGRSVAGRMLPKIIGPSGIDTILQVGLSGNSVFMVGPSSGTAAPTIWGGTLTTAATMSSQQTIASANPWQATYRKRFQTSTTAGNLSGMRTAYVQWFRGNAAGYGGFFFRAQFGQNINLNGAQAFVGLCASTAALAATAGSVAALVNMCGVGYDTTDASTGNWFFYRNDGSGTATKIDLGATNAARNTTHGYDLIMFTPPNGADLFVRIINLHNGATVLDTSYNTDLPAVNTGMAFKAEVNNGAVAAAANLEVAKVYIESDY